MYVLPFESVTAWIKFQNLWLPQSIDFNCPHCNRIVNFNTSGWQHRPALEYASCSAQCAGCRKKVQFWAIGPSNFGDTGKRECDELCIHPTPTLNRQPMAGLSKVPSAVARAYVSAVNVFNTGEWSGTAVLCGRALEALLKDLLPESSSMQTLARQLEQLRSLDLTRTLNTLTDGIRKGRNLGAHFDLDREPDAEMAQMMVDLLDYFLEYLYILPGRVEELHGRL